MPDERADVEVKTIVAGGVELLDGGATLAGESTLAGGPPDGDATVSPSPSRWDDRTLADPGLAGRAWAGPADRAAPTVAGYEILGELGRGAMGVVYHARQVLLNRPCALKMILAGEHSGPEAALRFLAEAEAVARIEHPNVVRIYTLGESAGLPFVELEYAPGGSLDTRLDGVPWDPRAAARMVEAAARGVAEAHRLGVVHRDLKPANILLGGDGTPKVADFGLAKSLGHDSGLTRTESIMGSPSYMAPEQAEGKAREVGPPADVHALGAVLYELLTGRPPFRGATILETLAQVKANEPVSPKKLRPGLPRDLETIALKCLEKAPARRYESAAGLAADLGRWLGGEPIAARPSPFWERGWKLARRRPWQAALAASAVAFGVGLLGVWAWSYARIGDALEDARVDRVKAEFARVRSDRLAASESAARAESTRRSAALALDKGVLLAESGRVGRGLLWMGRAYESAAGLDEPLRRAARASLADWGRSATRPLSVDDLGVIAFNLDARGGPGVVALGTSARPMVLDLAAPGPGPSFPMDMDYKVTAVVSRDGRRLAAADGTEARAWDLPTGAQIGRFPPQVPAVRPDDLAIDASGRRVALVDFVSRKLWVWDLADGGREARSASPEVGYDAVAFSPDGRLIAAVGRDRVARAWDARTLALVREFPPRPEASRAEFLPAGSCLVLWGLGASPTVAAWDLDAPRPRFERTIGATITGLALPPDGGSLLVGGRDGSIRLLDAATGEPVGPVIRAGAPVATFVDTRGQDGMGSRSAVALSPDGRTILSTHADATARAWDVTTGRPVGSILEHPGGLVGAAFGADGRTVLTVTRDGQVARWALADGPTGRPLAHRAGLGIDGGEVSPDGRLVVATGAGLPFAALVDGDAGLPRSAPLLHGGHAVRVARFRPDGSLVATGGDDASVRLWDTAGRPVGRPLATRHWVTALAFSPDGRTLAALDAVSSLYAWDVASGRLLDHASPADEALYVQFLLFSPDGRTLLTRTMGEAILRWEVPDLRRVGEPFRPFAVEEQDTTRARMDVSGVRPIAFSSDGVTLWVAESGKRPGPSVVRRRDFATWRAVGDPIGRDVDSAVLARDGRRLLTRSGTTVRQYDAATGRAVGVAMEHPSSVLTMALGPDGSTIATGADDGGLRFWDAATGRPVGPPRPHPGPVRDLTFVGDGTRVATFVDLPTFWDVPLPSADDPARVSADVRVASLMELDDDGDGTRRLSPDAWRSLRDGPGGGDPPPSAGWHARAAARFALQGPPEAALWHLDRLLADRPDDAPALLRRAGVRAELGDMAGAAADESSAAALAPGLVDAWRAWRAFDRLGGPVSAGRVAEALADLDRLIAARPDDRPYRARRAEILARAGRRAEAAAGLLDALRSGSTSMSDFHYHALLSLDLGDRAGYRENCARLLSLLPPDPPSSLANEAAWGLVLGEPADPARVVSLAEAAVAGPPADRKREAINTLGAALYRAGRFAEAADRLAESVRLASGVGVPQDWAFLALAHHRRGDTPAARPWLDRLRAWSPSGMSGRYWDDLEIELLRREAVSVLLLDPAFPADPFRRD